MNKLQEALSVVVHCGPLSCNGTEGVKEGDLGVVQHCSVEGKVRKLLCRELNSKCFLNCPCAARDATEWKGVCVSIKLYLQEMAQSSWQYIVPGGSESRVAFYKSLSL